MTAATSKPPDGEKKTREKDKKDAPPSKVWQGRSFLWKKESSVLP